MAVVEQGGRYVATVEMALDLADQDDYNDTKEELELAAKSQITDFVNNKNNTSESSFNLSGVTNDSVTSFDDAVASGSVVAVWSVAVDAVTPAEEEEDDDVSDDDDDAPSDVEPSGDLQGPSMLSRGSKDFKITDLGGDKWRVEIGWPMPTQSDALSWNSSPRSAYNFGRRQLVEHLNATPPYDGETKCATITVGDLKNSMKFVYSNWVGRHSGQFVAGSPPIGSSGAKDQGPPDNYLVAIYEATAIEQPCPDAAADPDDDDTADPADDAADTPEGSGGDGGMGKEADGPHQEPETPPPGGESTPDDPEKDEETEEKVSLDPIDYQCVLLERIMKLKDQHEELSGKYQKIITVDTNADPGNTLSTINHGGQTAAVKEILSLCPDIHALLVPYIKISRVDYDKNGKPNGKEAPLKIPNFVSQEDVESILSGAKGRIPGAGIKSFSWALEGVQPEEVDNNITATLVVWFQSVGDFFDDAAQAGVLGPNGEPEPNFLDLIINSPGIAKKKKASSPSKKPKNPCLDVKHREYKGANFRIKVVAGWATPPNLEKIYPELAMPSPSDNNMTRAQALKDAIEATRVSLFLQQTRHDIDFKENGSLQLTVNYQASLTGILTAPNSDIFSPGKNENTIAAKRDKLDKLKSEDADRVQADQEEQNEEEIEELLEEIKELEETDKLARYRKLLAKLYEADKVYHIEVPVSELLEAKQQFKMSEEDRLERAREKWVTDVVVAKTSEYESALLDEIKKDKAGKKDAKKTKKDNKKAQKGKDDLVSINFMYLGDMIDNILLQIDENNGGEPLDFAFFLSQTQFIDAQYAATIENIDKWAQCGDLRDSFYRQAITNTGGKTRNMSKMYKIINIGDIPISIRSFQNWYIKNVIDKDRDSYYLLHFIKDMTAQLITNALRGRCFGKNLKLYQRFDVQPLSFNKKGQARPLTRLRGCVSLDALARASAALDPTTDVKDVGMGMILISTDTNPSSLTANFDDDLARGIYHQYIGSACSLLKKVNFKREDMPYLREAKIQKEGALGPEQLRELYSVSIDMVGNNLYKNGTYVYVSPLLMNTAREQLNYLGLHGYYLVTGVKSEVTETSFKTSITALQEGIEFHHGAEPQHAPTTDSLGRPLEDNSGCAAPGPGDSPSSNPSS